LHSVVVIVAHHPLAIVVVLVERHAVYGGATIAVVAVRVVVAVWVVGGHLARRTLSRWKVEEAGPHVCIRTLRGAATATCRPFPRRHPSAACATRATAHYRHWRRCRSAVGGDSPPAGRGSNRPLILSQRGGLARFQRRIPSEVQLPL